MLNHPLVPKFIETPVGDTLPQYHMIAQMLGNYCGLRSLLTYTLLYLNCYLPIFGSVGKICITF